MHLEKLSLWNFKNYEEANLDLNPRINVFVGKNGSGKTNLLDAIYFLALTKSAFSTTDSQCIRKGENSFLIKGLFLKEDKPLELISSLQSGARKILKENQLEYEKFSDHIGKYPVVLIAPDDTSLVKDGSEGRRKFFDGIIAQVDKIYLECLLRYNQALKNRNLLLKMFYENGKADFLALESYDRIIIETGKYIYKRRLSFVKEFAPVFQKHYSFLVEDSEETKLRYASPLHEIEYDEGIKRSRQKDMLLQRTNFGVHRDDFEFLLENGEMKRFGSQGQQKSFVIALKLAQYDTFESLKGFKPIMLLDDIFDKLDDHRIMKLLEIMKSGLGQLFVTDARPRRTVELLNQIGVSGLFFQVSKGVITKT